MREYLEALHDQWTEEHAELRRLQRLWEMKRPAINVHIAELYQEIHRLEDEIDDILLAKMRERTFQ